MHDKHSSAARSLDAGYIVLICGFLALAVSFGIRATFGLFVLPIHADLGWSITALSLTLAVQNLLWGAAQPLAGALADTRGAPAVMIVGFVLYAAGLATMAYSSDLMVFGLGAGLLIGFAQSAIGFPIVLGAIGRTVPEERRSLCLGIATAGGSFGQFVFAPLGQSLLAGFGWINALLIMSMICVGAAALALGMRADKPGKESNTGNHTAKGPVDGVEPGLRTVLSQAARHRGFMLLVAGFFVCGFQLSFIVVHLPAFAALCGLSATSGSTGLALIGLFNIAGTIAAGLIGAHYRPKFPLAMIYFGRAIACTAMVLVPVTAPVLYGFSVVMGLLWLSTVPLTSGVVSQIFGPKYLGTLFGIVFFSHQVGSFVGVWLGGYVFETTGSYTLIWWLSAALAVAAGLIHLPIDDRRIDDRRMAEPSKVS